MNAAPGSLSRLYQKLSQRRRRQLLLLLLLMLAGSMAELASLGAIFPFLALIANPAKAFEYPALQTAFGALGWQDQNQILLPATLLFVSAALVAAAVRLLVLWATNKYAFALGFDLGSEVYRRVLHQPYLFHVARNSSEILSGLDKVQGIIGTVILPLLQTVIAATTALAIIATLLYINAPAAGAASAAFALIYLGVTASMRSRLQANSKVIAKSMYQRVQSVQEGLGGIRDVLLDNTQNVYIKKFATIDARLRETQASNSFIGVAPRYVIEAFGMALVAALAYTLSRQGGGLTTALPVLGALALGAQKLLPLLQIIYSGWTRLAGNTHVLKDVLEFIELPMPDQNPAPAGGEPFKFGTAISLKNLHFKYSSDGSPTLSNINLSIPKGARVGFIGKTGSGKSTLLDVIMGLLPPDSGQLLVDGQAITASNRRQWQTHIAHVPQAIYLSDASLAENIAFGQDLANIDMAQVKKAAQQAQIASHIESLPNGYLTPVGERGVRLSGGQRQRIGIARALYKKAEVLVLDEATSALDNETETAVMECIAGLSKDLTVLIIAHRISTLRQCDFVVRMQGGVVIENTDFVSVSTKPDDRQ